MSDFMSTETPAPRSTSRRRKVQALLAGGLVLGIGAAGVLAAWNDSEFATGTFTAGTFNLQGSTTSATAGYADHASAGGAASLTFTTPFNNLSPASVVYAPFWVRLAENTSTPATLDLVSIASTDAAGAANSANLSYSVYGIGASATCNASATNGTLLGQGTTLASGAVAGATVPLSIGAPTTSAGAAQQLCFVVTAGPALAQGGSTTATWQFTATSN